MNAKSISFIVENMLNFINLRIIFTYRSPVVPLVFVVVVVVEDVVVGVKVVKVVEAVVVRILVVEDVFVVDIVEVGLPKVRKTYEHLIVFEITQLKSIMNTLLV